MSKCRHDNGAIDSTVEVNELAPPNPNSMRFTVFTLLVLSLSVAGCGGSESVPQPEPIVVEEVPPFVTEIVPNADYSVYPMPLAGPYAVEGTYGGALAEYLDAWIQGDAEAMTERVQPTYLVSEGYEPVLLYLENVVNQVNVVGATIHDATGDPSPEFPYLHSVPVTVHYARHPIVRTESLAVVVASEGGQLGVNPESIQLRGLNGIAIDAMAAADSLGLEL